MKQTLDDLEIRSLKLTHELEEVRRLESNIWGENDSVPTHQTLTAVKNGGLVLGAYMNGELIAFQYSFPGFNGQSVYLCSHILGTDPTYRNKGIGEKLKRAQAKEALKLGYSLITWTYDPLESVNGYLNIGKLGAASSTYIPNCYGEMEDLLNSGIPSDRLLVEWDITSDPSKVVIEDASVQEKSVLKWTLDESSLPASPSFVGSLNEGIQTLPIPKDFRNIRDTNIELANTWRMETRAAFETLFAGGYQVTGFKKIADPSIPVNAYILTKGGL